MKDVIAPAKKIVAREPKVAKSGMGKQSSGTYNKDCHGSIPGKLNVREIARKVLKSK